MQVLDYDPKKKKFLVQVLNSRTQKYVGRLSLQFHEEDPEKFRQRVELAKERQTHAEDEMRFYRYVDSLPDESVSSLSAPVFNILEIYPYKKCRLRSIFKRN